MIIKEKETEKVIRKGYLRKQKYHNYAGEFKPKFKKNNSEDSEIDDYEEIYRKQNDYLYRKKINYGKIKLQKK